ncbi:MAG: peroxiredoxin family protein [Terriglobia bacterium]
MLKAGEQAPDFAANGMDGREYALRDALARGPLLVVFFKISCTTSQFTAPHIERLYQQIASRGGQIWGISQDSATDTSRFARQYSLTVPILLDEKPYLLSRQYGLKFVPSIFLVDPDTRIRMAFDGFSKRDLLETQGFFADHFSFVPPPFFPDAKKIPQYKPG